MLIGRRNTFRIILLSSLACMLTLIVRKEHSQNTMFILTCIVAVHYEEDRKCSLDLYMTFKNLYHLSTIVAQFLAMLKEVVCGIDTRFGSNWDFNPPKLRISEEGLTLCNLDPRKVRPFFGLWTSKK